MQVLKVLKNTQNQPGVGLNGDRELSTSFINKLRKTKIVINLRWKTANTARHRIAARLRFGMNVNSLRWAAARDGWR